MSNICILCMKTVLKYSVSKMSIHVFPSCPKKRQIWLNRCKLANEEVLPNRKICSFHFEPTCFKTGLKRRLLYPDAVPTIFGKAHVKTTNLPLKNVKGKPKNVIKDRIAVQHLQLHRISPTKAIKKGIARWNHELCDIPLTRYAKKVLAEKNRQSLDVPLTRALNKEIFGHNRKSCDFSLTGAAEKLIACKNHQSRDILQVKTVKNGIASQNTQSHNISQPITAKKVISSRNSQSHDISPTKTVKKEIAGQNTRSRNISQTITAKKVISSRNSQSCDFKPTKGFQKIISGQNHVSYSHLPTRVFELEVLQRSMNIVANQKRELERQNETIAILEKKKLSLLLQLEIARNKISLANIAK